MSPDEFQQAWQSQAPQTRIPVDLLLKEFERNESNFRGVIDRRDTVEVGLSLVMIPIWIGLGIAFSLPWTWYLMIPVCLWVAGYMLAYRARHPQRPSPPEASLVECAQNALTQVENQIWLLRNVFWWYLLPPSIALTLFFIDTSFRMALKTNQWILSSISLLLMMSFLVGLYTFIYHLNQYAVRKSLEPRRQELLDLIAGLKEEGVGE